MRQFPVSHRKRCNFLISHRKSSSSLSTIASIFSTPPGHYRQLFWRRRRQTSAAMSGAAPCAGWRARCPRSACIVGPRPTRLQQLMPKSESADEPVPELESADKAPKQSAPSPSSSPAPAKGRVGAVGHRSRRSAHECRARPAPLRLYRARQPQLRCCARPRQGAQRRRRASLRSAVPSLCCCCSGPYSGRDATSTRAPTRPTLCEVPEHPSCRGLGRRGVTGAGGQERCHPAAHGHVRGRVPRCHPQREQRHARVLRGRAAGLKRAAHMGHHGTGLLRQGRSRGVRGCEGGQCGHGQEWLQYNNFLNSSAFYFHGFIF